MGELDSTAVVLQQLYFYSCTSTAVLQPHLARGGAVVAHAEQLVPSLAQGVGRGGWGGFFVPSLFLLLGESGHAHGGFGFGRHGLRRGAVVTGEEEEEEVVVGAWASVWMRSRAVDGGGG
jgi:hypothetical protein